MSLVNPLTNLSLLGVFNDTALQPDSSEWHVLECAQDALTYRQLWLISNRLSIDLYETYGARPTVAIVSENHPYTLALMLAIWKIGGIVAPLDTHAPAALMQGMLAKIAPDCVVMPVTDKSTRKIVNGSSLLWLL